MRKLKWGLAYLAILVAMAGQVQAGIITYTPSGTGTVSTGTYLAWDMESPATAVGVSSGEPYEFFLSDHGDIHPNLATENIVTLNSSSTGADILAPGTLIDASSPFSPENFAGTTSFSGVFTSESQGLIGLRFDIGGQTHYGWAELEFTGGNQSLLQWAYEDQANVGILAGDTGVSAVPEPSSLALFGIGACVAGLGAARRRRREKQQEATA